jgi:hypothetical protein
MAQPIAKGIDQAGAKSLEAEYISPPLTPASSSRLNGTPMNPFSPLERPLDLKVALPIDIGVSSTRNEGKRHGALPLVDYGPVHPCFSTKGAVPFTKGAPLAERDDGGDT